MDTNVTPATFKEAVGNETPQAAPSATPAAGEQTPEKPVVEEAKPADPTEKPQEHDWKKRFDGVDKDHKQLSEEHGQLIDANVKLAEKNPQFLEDLAETDAKLADKVSQKMHGKSYQDYKESAKLEEMKGSDPEGYDREKRLRSLEEKEAQRITDSRKKFLGEKGVKDNEFDPAYKKIHEQLNLLNPKFVEENPDRALEMAYGLAFPTSSDPAEAAKAAHLANNTSNKGGSMSPKMDTKASPLSPAAQAFRDKMGALTGK